MIIIIMIIIIIIIIMIVVFFFLDNLTGPQYFVYRLFLQFVTAQ